MWVRRLREMWKPVLLTLYRQSRGLRQNSSRLKLRTKIQFCGEDTKKNEMSSWSRVASNSTKLWINCRRCQFSLPILQIWISAKIIQLTCNSLTFKLHFQRSSLKLWLGKLPTWALATSATWAEARVSSTCKIFWCYCKSTDTKLQSTTSTLKFIACPCNVSMHATTYSWSRRGSRLWPPPYQIVLDIWNKTAFRFWAASKRLSRCTNTWSEIMTMKIQAQMFSNCPLNTILVILLTFQLDTLRGL